MESDYESLMKIMNDPHLYNREKLRAMEEQGRKDGTYQDGLCSRCRQPLIKITNPKLRIYHPSKTYLETCEVADDKAEVAEIYFFDIEFLDLPEPGTSW